MIMIVSASLTDRESKKGISVFDICDVLNSYDIPVHAYKAKFRCLKGPCIVYLKRLHHFICADIRPDKVVVMDERIGKALLNRWRFRLIYSGIVITQESSSD